MMGSSEGTFDTTLHEAVRYGDLDEVKTALQHGYDPNLIGLYQWSPLHEAAHNGDVDILKLLLDKKGDPNKCDYLRGRSAVHYAAEGSHVECLRMLVDVGGRYDVRDQDGKTCLDVATGKSCRDILEKQRVKDLMKMTPEEAKKSILESHSQSSSDHSPTPVLSDSTEKLHSKELPFKALGQVNMSVEYHATKETMKVRVWQVSDLLLPPANASMIHAVFVKVILQPDKKRDSKRKTEEVKVQSSGGHVHMHKGRRITSAQHVFTPATFKFSKPLEYSGITKALVNERHLQIEVCLVQKHSRKNFLIGMMELPLKTAVRKVVRENYPLIPCMNHTIPSGMKVYSASELQITSSAKIFYSNPNFRAVSSASLDKVSERASSDPDLKRVVIHSSTPSPSTSIELPEFPQGEELQGVRVNDESGYFSEIHIPIPGEMDSPESDKSVSFTGSDSAQPNIHTIDMEKESQGKLKSVIKNMKTTFQPRSRDIRDLRGHGLRGIRSDDDETETESYTSGVEDWKYNDIRTSSGAKHSSSFNSETPTWDYYDFGLATVDIPVDDGPSADMGAILPMETSLQQRKKGDNSDEKLLTGDHSVLEMSQQRKKKDRVDENLMKGDHSKDKVDHAKEDKGARPKIKMKKKVPVPGKAVQVPSIVVTPAEPHGAGYHGNTNSGKQHSEIEIIDGECDDDNHRVCYPAVTPRHIDIDLDHAQKAQSGRKIKVKVVGNTTKQTKDIHPESGNVKYSLNKEATIVDIDSLSLASEDSFVIDLEHQSDVEPLSGREPHSGKSDLSGAAALFSPYNEESHMSSTSDIETGLSNISRLTRQKNVIPMQVFIDEMSESENEMGTFVFNPNLNYQNSSTSDA